MTDVDSRDDLDSRRPDMGRIRRSRKGREVYAYVNRLEADLRMLLADRDAAVASVENLARQLEESRSENDHLRAKLDRVSRSPIEADGLSDRLFRMVELAQDEAAEITERARAAAERSWAAAEQAAQRLRERHDALVAEVAAQRRDAIAEHHELLRRARAETEETAEQAAKERQKLDDEAAQRRREIEKDFDEAMRLRRADAVAVIEKQEREAAAERAKLLSETEETARKLLNQAQREADTVHEHRTRTVEELQELQRLLAQAEPILAGEPSDDAEPEAPDAAVPEPRPPANRPLPTPYPKTEKASHPVAAPPASGAD